MKKKLLIVLLVVLVLVLTMSFAGCGVIAAGIAAGQVSNAKKEAVRQNAIEYYNNVQQAAMWTELGTQVCFEEKDGKVTPTDELCEYLMYVMGSYLMDGEVYVYMKSTTELDGVVFTNSNGVGGRGMAGTTDLSSITDASDIPADATFVLEVSKDNSPNIRVKSSY